MKEQEQQSQAKDALQPVAAAADDDVGQSQFSSLHSIRLAQEFRVQSKFLYLRQLPHPSSSYVSTSLSPLLTSSHSVCIPCLWACNAISLAAHCVSDIHLKRRYIFLMYTNIPHFQPSLDPTPSSLYPSLCPALPLLQTLHLFLRFIFHLFLAFFFAARIA